MSSTNKTTHYELSQYVSSDKPTYLSDYNGDMLKIDTAINTAKTTADSASTAATNAATAASGAQTTADTAVTNAATAQTTANTATNNIGTMANLTTSEKNTLVGAINEVDGDIGNLASLDTTAKNSIVAAINELADGAEEYVLYNNESGSASTIVLNDLITNYDRVFIYYTQANWCEAYEVDGTRIGYHYGAGNDDYINKISIDAHHLYDISGTIGYVQEIVSTYTIETIVDSGIQKTRMNKQYSAWRINNLDWNVDNSMIKIYKIIGFKK